MKYSVKKLASLHGIDDARTIATGFDDYLLAFDWLTHLVKDADSFYEIIEEEDEESSSADLEACFENEDNEDWEPDITPEDYIEWCASSCGMTYNAYIGKPWLD